MLRHRITDELETLSSEEITRLSLIMTVAELYPESLHVIAPPDDHQYHVLNVLRQALKLFGNHLRRW